jgi:hypothetical protein
VSLRMLTNLRLADLRLTTAQQTSTGQNLLFNLYMRNKDIAASSVLHHVTLRHSGAITSVFTSLLLHCPFSSLLSSGAFLSGRNNFDFQQGNTAMWNRPQARRKKCVQMALEAGCDCC